MGTNNPTELYIYGKVISWTFQKWNKNIEKLNLMMSVKGQISKVLKICHNSNQLYILSETFYGLEVSCLVPMSWLKMYSPIIWKFPKNKNKKSWHFQFSITQIFRQTFISSENWHIWVKYYWNYGPSNLLFHFTPHSLQDLQRCPLPLSYTHTFS